MDKYDSQCDQYCYPGTDVLINKFDIRDEDELEQAEKEITSAAIYDIFYQAPPYDLLYYRNLHATLFSALYEWAGKIREVDISKGSTPFCHFSYIVPEINKLFSQLEADNWLAGLSKDEFCQKLADYYCEFNIIHPFREGNGRIQRLFFEHLALSAGYELNWSLLDRDEWLQANIAGVLDSTPMKNIFLKRCEKCV